MRCGQIGATVLSALVFSARPPPDPHALRSEFIDLVQAASRAVAVNAPVD